MHSRYSRVVLSALALLASAGTVSAAVGRIITEVSDNDGATWGTLAIGVPGVTYQFRVRVRLTEAPTEVLGIAGCSNIQPTVTNWSSENFFLPFTNSGGGGVEYSSTTSALGRINPFAFSVMGPGSSNGLPTAFNDGGNTLRIAGSRATSAASVQWGLIVAQAPPNLGGTSFVTANDVVVLKYAITLGPSGALGGDLVASVPLDTMGGNRSIFGYTSPSGGTNFAHALSAADFVSARIVVPTPASGTVLAVGVLACRRRRR
jgi:hypothetical protein